MFEPSAIVTLSCSNLTQCPIQIRCMINHVPVVWAGAFTQWQLSRSCHRLRSGGLRPHYQLWCLKICRSSRRDSICPHLPIAYRHGCFKASDAASKNINKKYVTTLMFLLLVAIRLSAVHNTCKLSSPHVSTHCIQHFGKEHPRHLMMRLVSVNKYSGTSLVHT